MAPDQSAQGQRPPRYRVGVAGWSYPDWEGIVYPPGKIDQLAYVAQYFDTIEINTTFYHPAPAKNIDSWLRRVERFPDFRFTVKLWQRFTHDPTPFGREEIDAVLPALRTIASEGRLGALLMQFPYSFKNRGDARARLARILDAFAGFPAVVEVRHASLNVPGFYDFLRERGAGFCNIDQPQVSRSIAPTTIATSKVGYVRLHGRNEKEWFSENADRTTRYNYYYSKEELAEWVDRIVVIGRNSADVYVIANNHYRGQAPANGLRLKSLLNGAPVEAPSTLVEAFPDLREVVKQE